VERVKKLISYFSVLKIFFSMESGDDLVRYFSDLN